MDLMEYFGKPEILIIDDDMVTLDLMKEILCEKYSVITAKDSREGLEVIENNIPDLVILGCMVPLLSESDVCKRMKSYLLTSDIPVIFINSMGESECDVNGLELGFVDYISKPINPVIVKLRVKNHIELKRSKDILKRLFSIDGLTGIASRRSFEDGIEREWRRCLRNGEWLSLLMIDIDCLKKINDTYGHLYGDQCIIAVAQILRSVIKRGGDLFARFGGGKFVVMLPETDIKSATVCAKKIISGVRSLGVKSEKSIIPDMLTVSIGASSIVPTLSKGVKMIINQTDEALYTAKNKGRNRVEQYIKE